jgi:hypothetical protein
VRKSQGKGELFYKMKNMSFESIPISDLNSNLIFQVSQDFFELKYDYPVKEFKLSRIIMSYVELFDKEFTTYRFRASMLCDLLSLAQKSKYNILCITLNNLKTRNIIIPGDFTKSGKIIECPLLSIAQMNWDDLTAIVKIHNNFRRFLLWDFRDERI